MCLFSNIYKLWHRKYVVLYCCFIFLLDFLFAINIGISIKEKGIQEKKVLGNTNVRSQACQFLYKLTCRITSDFILLE